MSPGKEMKWEPFLQGHILGMSWTPEAIFPRTLPHIFHNPSLEMLSSKAQSLQQVLLTVFLVRLMKKWVSSRQGREQLFWFRISTTKKSSESNNLHQLDQHQIPECPGFSLFDKVDKRHAILSQQRDITLSKEIKHSCCHIYFERHKVGQGCVEPAPGAGSQ